MDMLKTSIDIFIMFQITEGILSIIFKWCKPFVYENSLSDVNNLMQIFVNLP